jgi:hypothetical protein
LAKFTNASLGTYNKVKDVPTHVTQYIEKINKDNRQYVEELLTKAGGGTGKYGDV